MSTCYHNSVLNQESAPLAEAVIRHARMRRAGTASAFHFPAHKGRAMMQEVREIFCDALIHDLTELPGLDDLHAPQGVIHEAQRLAACAFGARSTFFLVGGASAGVLASLGSIEGSKKIALCRNAHRSAVSALRLSGATPVWVYPCADSECYIPQPCDANELCATGADALFLVSPTYEGIVGSLDMCCDAPLIVDEAHGAHFYFSDEMPQGALLSNVAAVIHGAHKTLGSLTGTGLLHLKTDKLSSARVSRMLSTVQTTSPSYLMMASLDLARKHMVTHGENYISIALQEARAAREKLERSGIQVLCPERSHDELRLVVPSAQFKMSGNSLERRLREHGVWAEYAGLLHVVLVFSIGDVEGSHTTLVDALQRVSLIPRGCSDEAFYRAREAAKLLASPEGMHQAMTPQEAWQAPSKSVALSNSAGHVAAESVFVYPPGNALIVEGEQIPYAFNRIVSDLKFAGIRFHGTEDLSVGTIRVVTS